MARLKARPKANPYDVFSDEELTEQKDSFWAAYHEALLPLPDADKERGRKAYRDAIDIENELKRRNDLTPMTLLVNGLKSR